MIINTKLKFKAKISSILPLNHPLKIAVAVSGGSDSLALLILLRNSLQEHDIQLYCVTVDHDLRIDSHQEALKVKDIAESLGVKHCILKWEGNKPSANLQHLARKMRYKLLVEFCKANQIDYLATGHQQLDEAENFLIRLEHGTGLYGLSGIAEKTNFQGIKIIRPLLSFSKEELIAILEEEKIEWIEDPSNLNLKFTRTKFRNLLKKNPYWVLKLNLASKNLAQAKEAIEFFLNKTLKEIVKVDEAHISFKYNDFNLLPQEIKFRLLSKLIEEQAMLDKPLRGERIANLIDKIALGNKFKASTLGKCIIKRKKDLIIISLENLKH